MMMRIRVHMFYGYNFYLANHVCAEFHGNTTKKQCYSGIFDSLFLDYLRLFADYLSDYFRII